MSCDGVLKMLGSKPCIYYNQHQNEIQHELSLSANARTLCACGGDCARATATPEGNAVSISDSLDHAVQEQALNAGQDQIETEKYLRKKVVVVVVVEVETTATPVGRTGQKRPQTAQRRKRESERNPNMAELGQRLRR
jgi:hypothetical protein